MINNSVQLNNTEKFQSVAVFIKYVITKGGLHKTFNKILKIRNYIFSPFFFIYKNHIIPIFNMLSLMFRKHIKIVFAFYQIIETISSARMYATPLLQ